MTDNDIKPALNGDKADTALDIAAFVGSVVPWIGGPVSNVLGGMSLGRKLKRVHEVLGLISTELEEFKSDASEDYVNTEDFEDILEQALKRVGEERNEVKRKIYGAFLLGAIREPGEGYDEQLRFLKALEDVQIDHLRVLEALLETPGNPKNSITGSPSQTLSRRLPEMDSDHIEEIVSQLNDMRLAKLTSLKVMMTPSGAEDLRHSVTGHGVRFIEYLKNA
ncbi:hypothetical protein [uncultured Desulfuromonas sp.]|uniref:hypothetical protein n=1 Tax=uncultured Desulfuromonas sp. TaxID=181013 RepID=UPI002AAC4492|nr:hypothetical protein [uncultured Desulfuromonas sp.]